MSDPAGRLIVEIHRHGQADNSPVQMFSAELLAYYASLEREVLELRALVAEIHAALAERLE